MEDRFPDIKGSRRWRLIQIIYGLRSLETRGLTTASTANLKVERHTLKLFKYEDGTAMRILKRAPTNSRRQDSVVRKYAGRVLSEGAAMLCRGMPIAVATNNKDEFEMLAAATLTEAVYVAHSMDSTNEYIKQVEQDGFSDVLVLAQQTPSDVQKWCAQDHNKYHNGTGANWIEKCVLAEEVEKHGTPTRRQMASQ